MHAMTQLLPNGSSCKCYPTLFFPLILHGRSCRSSDLISLFVLFPKVNAHCINVPGSQGWSQDVVFGRRR